MAEKRTTGIWVAAVIVALIFFAAGIPKIIPWGTLWRDWVLRFAVWGYPGWLVVVVGVLETAAAAAVLVPRFAFAGAATLTVIMAGALVTHFTHREGVVMLRPIVMFALLYPILNKERPRSLITKLRGLIPKKPDDTAGQ